MAVRTMRAVEHDEVPMDGGIAVQDHADRPVFRGNGAEDYVCVACGNLLASAMDPAYMTRRVRVRCGRCRTINIAAEVPYEPARRPRRPGLQSSTQETSSS